ncbi:larval cuticle protein 65Ag1-like [Bactrocera neohumeralis]|uniref:larval cuticle protein 65Ag1-like n=1 Tax=Bactrocera tryoni TaxID=59916 RepID=UPI001A9960D8|nr:larval cuticle protein 65Ag1-like [Bactrocera tryoni]XP_050333070.1 larval cuticle protein 65Ag1-like [Bactrocera neohumeralis]
MKFVIVFVVVCIVSVMAAPAPQQEVQVLRYDSDVEPEGYKFLVETSDGKLHEEEGKLKDVGTDHEAIVVRGSFSYVGDDGQTYTVNYIADENGFQPEGAHLPRV